MLDIMCPLISESDVVSYELLDDILINVVEPKKTQQRNAYALAKEVINKCSVPLEPYIQAVSRLGLSNQMTSEDSNHSLYRFQLFNQVVLLGKQTHLNIFSKIYDVIYELNLICPSVLLAILPQLECKMRLPQVNERLPVIKLLAKMFSEKNSNLVNNNQKLWNAFLERRVSNVPRKFQLSIDQTVTSDYFSCTDLTIFRP